MPDYIYQEAQDGRVIVHYLDCLPLCFDGKEDFAAWEHAYLTCTMHGNGKRTCFTACPPQHPVDEGKGFRPKVG